MKFDIIENIKSLITIFIKSKWFVKFKNNNTEISKLFFCYINKSLNDLEKKWELILQDIKTQILISIIMKYTVKIIINNKFMMNDYIFMLKYDNNENIDFNKIV
jgi:hypothetical protein